MSRILVCPAWQAFTCRPQPFWRPLLGLSLPSAGQYSLVGGRAPPSTSIARSEPDGLTRTSTLSRLVCTDKGFPRWIVGRECDLRRIGRQPCFVQDGLFLFAIGIGRHLIDSATGTDQATIDEAFSIAPSRSLTRQSVISLVFDSEPCQSPVP